MARDMSISMSWKLSIALDAIKYQREVFEVLERIQILRSSKLHKNYFSKESTPLSVLDVRSVHQVSKK